MYVSNGCAVAVQDEDILKAQKMLASTEGVFVCPEGAATLSASVKLTESGWIKDKDKVVLLNTGTGLKYPDTVQAEPPILEPDDNLPRI